MRVTLDGKSNGRTRDKLTTETEKFYPAVDREEVD